jgi:carbonic anhydrase/acetyltransferase-like protein (isoleucine patch superfamily)
MQHIDDIWLKRIQQQPVKGKDVFIAPQAVVLGDVELADEVTVMFHAVVRADADSIHIGQGSNIQEHAMIHVDPGFPTQIGAYCTIGHGAIVHGAFLENHVLVGMHATVLNGAKIGKYTIIGAGALVTENQEIPPYSLVVGVPGKIIKSLGPEIEERIQRNAATYMRLGRLYQQHFHSADGAR